MMGDMGDDFRAFKEHKREQRRKFGVPCPACIKREPKRNPTILLPGQTCYCGYKDTRRREEGPR